MVVPESFVRLAGPRAASSSLLRLSARRTPQRIVVRQRGYLRVCLLQPLLDLRVPARVSTICPRRRQAATDCLDRAFERCPCASIRSALRGGGTGRGRLRGRRQHPFHTLKNFVDEEALHFLKLFAPDSDRLRVESKGDLLVVLPKLQGNYVPFGLVCDKGRPEVVHEAFVGSA